MLAERYVDLSPAAEERRLQQLVERIAREGLRAGESVPARVMAMVDARRDGTLEFVRAA